MAREPIATGPIGVGQTGAVRYLTIVRHAKAEKAEAGQADFDRVLNPKGRRQCEQLRAWATDRSSLGKYGPVTALVSAAARTTETFRRSFDGTDFVLEAHFSELIYNGLREVSAEDVLADLAAIDPVTTSLLVVGHNPTVLELLWTLVGDLPEPFQDRYPLGAAFVLALPDDRPVGLAHYELLEEFVPD